jgi:membrane protein required for colicin V production
VAPTLASLNWLDWIVLLLLGLSALDGMRRGLLLGALDLVGAAAGLVAAMLLERPVGDWLAASFESVPSALVHLGAFLLVLLLVQVAVGATLGRLVLAVARLIARTPLGWLDRLLGLVPGLVRGAITLTVLLLPFALVPFVPSISQGIEGSTVANRLVGAALLVTPILETRLGQDLEGGLPSLVVEPPESEDATARPLRAGPPSGPGQFRACWRRLTAAGRGRAAA